MDIWGNTNYFQRPTIPRVVLDGDIKLDMVMHDDKYVITADIPGVRRENVLITHSSVLGSLTIKTANLHRPLDTGLIVIGERLNCDCVRILHFTKGEVDFSTTTVELDSGVLTVCILKIVRSDTDDTTMVEIN
jgi:HSP20 family molecular chaperone IbpA